MLSRGCMVHRTGCSVALDRHHDGTELGKALMLEPTRDATLGVLEVLDGMMPELVLKEGVDGDPRKRPPALRP